MTKYSSDNPSLDLSMLPLPYPQKQMSVTHIDGPAHDAILQYLVRWGMSKARRQSAALPIRNALTSRTKLVYPRLRPIQQPRHDTPFVLGSHSAPNLRATRCANVSFGRVRSIACCMPRRGRSPGSKRYSLWNQFPQRRAKPPTTPLVTISEKRLYCRIR